MGNNLLEATKVVGGSSSILDRRCDDCFPNPAAVLRAGKTRGNFSSHVPVTERGDAEDSGSTDAGRLHRPVIQHTNTQANKAEASPAVSPKQLAQSRLTATAGDAKSRRRNWTTTRVAE